LNIQAHHANKKRTPIKQSYTATTANPDLFGRLYSLLPCPNGSAGRARPNGISRADLIFFLLSFFVSQDKKSKEDITKPVKMLPLEYPSRLRQQKRITQTISTQDVINPNLPCTIVQKSYLT
jgi:hypothetical protein